MKRSLSKKSKKVIEENLEELKAMPPLRELTRIGARMMLQVALEEEITANLERDYYERTTSAKGSRNGSKPRTVKIGSGDIGIKDATGEKCRRAVSFPDTAAPSHSDG